MLIICNGMIRSGSTLQYNIVKSLLEYKNMGTGHGYFDLKQYVITERQLIQWANDSFQHVIKMHDIHPKSVELAKKDLVKICYIFRDIRDVAVSASNIWGIKGKKLITSLDEAIKIYYDLKDILNGPFQKYENVINDLPKAVKEIGNFLNIKIEKDVLNYVVKYCSIKNMKKKSNKMIFIKKLMNFIKATTPAKLRRLLRNIIKLDHYAYYDKNTLLHPGHISKSTGTTGLWKTAFDISQINLITDRYRSWLKENGYPLEM